MIRNYYLFVGIVITIISALPVLFYLLPQHLKALQIKSNNRRLKQYVLGLEIAFVFCMLPGLPRAIQVLPIPPYNLAAKVAAVSNRMPFIIVTTLLLLTHFYKLKPEDDE